MLDWATTIIETTGYIGVAFGMFLENIFPPIPSELIMIFAGASAEDGGMHIILIILAGALGSVVGLLPWYYTGKWYGKERFKVFANKHGRYLTFSGKDVDRADKWFDKYGEVTVVIGRFLPAIRTLVAIPAAIMNMNIWRFCIFAFIGSILWDGGFALIGYYVGEHSESLAYPIEVVSYIALAGIILWYLYRVTTFHKNY